MQRLLKILLLFMILYGCKQESNETFTSTGAQSVLWFQYSAEAEALFIQGYNIASGLILENLKNPGHEQQAVTLDLDETVLDNSAFQAQLLKENLSYTEEKWEEWCKRREAKALPGALDFTLLADSLGIEVFYVTNRKVSVLGATMENLAALGFPNADSAHILAKTSGSSKDARREMIRQEYEIILLIGDNLGDFDGIFDDRSENYGKEAVENFRKEFGKKFIMLPNPMYGTWVKGVFPQGIPGKNEVVSVLEGYDK